MPIINTRTKLKRDTASNWEENNPVLLSGELGIIVTDSGDIRLKAGDGENSYSELPFISQGTRPTAMRVTIDTSGWASDSDTAYPYYYDISVSGVTEKDRAEITIAPASLSEAASCGLCPTNETLEGKIRIRSVSVPKAVIAVEYWIENGKES